jgi:hypothetical protein
MLELTLPLYAEQILVFSQVFIIILLFHLSFCFLFFVFCFLFFVFCFLFFVFCFLFVFVVKNTAGGQLGGSANFRPSFGWDEYSATGNALTMTANRISFFFNLTGPSVTYDTACSAMLTALHGAHTALTQRECKLAILVSAVVHYGHAHNPSFAQLGVLSPDGRSRSFDDAANGCIFEGREGIGRDGREGRGGMNILLICFFKYLFYSI